MAKLHYQDAPTEDEKKSFARFLAEDEELVLATGLGKLYLRSYFVICLAWPGFIFMGVGFGLAYFFKFNLGVGLLGSLLVAALVAILKSRLLYHANRYLLTTRRVIIKKGVLTIKLTSALYDKITHIEVVQSFFDKLLMHHGSIIVNTAGTNKDEIILKFIDYPIEFKNILERMINREREQFGGRFGPVAAVEGELVD